MIMMMISIKFQKMIHKINQDAHDILVYSFFFPASQIKIMRSGFLFGSYGYYPHMALAYYPHIS